MQPISCPKTRSKDSLVILLLVYLKVALWKCAQSLCVLCRYYRNFRFFLIDTSLSFSYMFKSPYRMSREFLESRGVADVYAYGQTPLTTIDKVARQCGLHSKDVVYELGCGTARSCFWLASFVKCQAVGIDYLPAFIDHALRVKKRWNADLVTLRCENLFHADLRLASVVYVYGTNFEEKEILELIVLLKNVRRGTKIITVSYPLTDYTKEPLFRLTKQFQGSFPWGKATIYLQIKQ